MNTEIQNRIDAIIAEYAQLPEMENCELSLEAKDNGDVDVILTGLTKSGRKNIAERTIGAKEDLSFIADTIRYPDYIGRQSKDIFAKSVKMAYFDIDGYLVVDRKDGTTERTKIKEKHREEITKKLLSVLDGKLKLKTSKL